MPKKAITLRLDEDDVKLLERIKKYYNIKKDTEAIRLCIGDAHRIVVDKETD